MLSWLAEQRLRTLSFLELGGESKLRNSWVVTLFGFGETEHLPAPKTGGLYKFNWHKQRTVL